MAFGNGKKFFRHLITGAGAILGLAIITPLLSGFGIAFLTTSLGGFTNLSLAGATGAGVGAWVGAMVADKFRQ